VRLYLVRHAAVTVRADMPPAQWHLSPEGRTAAEALGAEPFWADVTAIASSTEPKAVGTAQRIAAPHGLPLRIEPDLREVARPWAGAGYRELVRRYFAGEALDGWEPREQASARVRACIDRVVAASAGRDTAVVFHGLALTLYLAGLLGLDSGAAYDFWSDLRFPDLAIADLDAQRLERGSGWTPETGGR
jgi:broad specificity phosphatase PhoE